MRLPGTIGTRKFASRGHLHTDGTQWSVAFEATDFRVICVRLTACRTRLGRVAKPPGQRSWVFPRLGHRREGGKAVSVPRTEGNDDVAYRRTSRMFNLSEKCGSTNSERGAVATCRTTRHRPRLKTLRFVGQIRLMGKNSCMQIEQVRAGRGSDLVRHAM